FSNVHHFAADHLRDLQRRAPACRVVIFDEAQRVWSRDRVAGSHRKKNSRQGNFEPIPEQYWDLSEPEQLLEVMGRHADWCVVVGLVGGGQEMQNGGGGLAEWGGALANQCKPWTVWSSPAALNGDVTLRGKTLFADTPHHRCDVTSTENLHLT